MKKPLGLIIIPYIEILKGALGLLFISYNFCAFLKTPFLLIALFVFGLKIFLGINLLELKEWARESFVIFLYVLLTYGILSLLACPWLWMLKGYVFFGVAVGAYFIYYYTHPKIKKYFE